MTEHSVDPGAVNPAVTLGLDTFGDVHTDSSGVGFRTPRPSETSSTRACSPRWPVWTISESANTIPKTFPSQPAYDLRNYDELFEEKVNLFAELLNEKPVTWSGNTRAALHGQTVNPRTESGHLSTWIGVGGNPESVVRAARYGFSLMIAIIGGETARVAPFTGLFHRALADFGHPERTVGVHSPGHVAATDERAIEEFWPHYETAFAEAARVRGFRPPTMQSFLRDVGPGGALHVGSPETVARKITETLKALGANCFDLKYGMPGMPQSQIVTSIELFGSRVAPLVRDMMA